MKNTQNLMRFCLTDEWRYLVSKYRHRSRALDALPCESMIESFSDVTGGDVFANGGDTFQQYRHHVHSGKTGVKPVLVAIWRYFLPFLKGLRNVV